jgi:hypothetical protein
MRSWLTGCIVGGKIVPEPFCKCTVTSTQRPSREAEYDWNRSRRVELRFFDQTVPEFQQEIRFTGARLAKEQQPAARSFEDALDRLVRLLISNFT